MLPTSIQSSGSNIGSPTVHKYHHFDILAGHLFLSTSPIIRFRNYCNLMVLSVLQSRSQIITNIQPSNTRFQHTVSINSLSGQVRDVDRIFLKKNEFKTLFRSMCAQVNVCKRIDVYLLHTKIIQRLKLLPPNFSTHFQHFHFNALLFDILQPSQSLVSVQFYLNSVTHSKLLVIKFEPSIYSQIVDIMYIDGGTWPELRVKCF